MFGAIKRLFSKIGRTETENRPTQVRPAPVRGVSKNGVSAEPPPSSAPETARATGTPQTSHFQRGAASNIQTAPTPNPPAAPAVVIPRAVVRLPMEPILARMPSTLTALLRRQDVNEIAIPLQVVSTQLTTGAIRMTFGEFRKLTPEGTFAENPMHDQVSIELPLKEVLARVNPQLLSRRPQRRIDVPETVTSVFGAGNTSFIRRPGVTAPVAPASAPRTEPAPTPAPAAPIPLTGAEAESSLQVAISTLSAKWPTAIVAQIEQHKLQEASVMIPISRLEPAIKTGRISFAWSDLAGWLRPGLPTGVVPDPTVWVDLPLNVIAPMFMARVSGAGRQRKKAAVGDTVPDVFTGKAEVPSQVPAPTHSMPANLADLMPKPVAYVPRATPPAAPEQRTDSIGEILSGLYKPDWSPVDLVNKTANLASASGALLATKDGLLVADKLPPHLNPETVSAFLPQMFARMNQYSTELQLGPLSSLTLMMGAVPCMILEAGSLFLIVLGRAGEQLPTAQIQQIATELAKRNS